MCLAHYLYIIYTWEPRCSSAAAKLAAVPLCFTVCLQVHPEAGGAECGHGRPGGGCAGPDPAVQWPAGERQHQRSLRHLQLPGGRGGVQHPPEDWHGRWARGSPHQPVPSPLAKVRVFTTFLPFL